MKESITTMSKWVSITVGMLILLSSLKKTAYQKCIKLAENNYRVYTDMLPRCSGSLNCNYSFKPLTLEMLFPFSTNFVFQHLFIFYLF
jgi:hypothetical protein